MQHLRRGERTKIVKFVKIVKVTKIFPFFWKFWYRPTESLFKTLNDANHTYFRHLPYTPQELLKWFCQNQNIILTSCFRGDAHIGWVNCCDANFVTFFYRFFRRSITIIFLRTKKVILDSLP